MTFEWNALGNMTFPNPHVSGSHSSFRSCACEMSPPTGYCLIIRTTYQTHGRPNAVLPDCTLAMHITPHHQSERNECLRVSAICLSTYLAIGEEYYISNRLRRSEGRRKRMFDLHFETSSPRLVALQGLPSALLLPSPAIRQNLQSRILLRWRERR